MWENQKIVKKFDIVQAWLDNVAYSHSGSKRTEESYSQGLNQFCDFIRLTPKQILEQCESTEYRIFLRRYAQFLRAYISELRKNGYTTNSIKTKVTAVKSFFKYNDLPLGFVPNGRTKVEFHNRDITKEDIVRIMGISRIRDKAFFCIMAQTGIRIDTLCNLKLKHIQPDFKNGVIPCKVEVPQEIAKGKYRSYFTFMGEESVKYLKAYLASRRQNITVESFLFTSYGKDTKLNRKSISVIFKDSIEKLKAKGLIDFEQKAKRKPRTVRLYSLRKFFRKFAHQAGFEFVQFWMGHIVHAGVDEHYRPKDVEFHRKLYAEKAMPYLRLETATPSETELTITELRKQLEERDEVMKKLQPLIEFADVLENEEARYAVSTFFTYLKEARLGMLSDKTSSKKYDRAKFEREMEKESKMFFDWATRYPEAFEQLQLASMSAQKATIRATLEAEKQFFEERARKKELKKRKQ